jgi:sugar lactone lactonase YvrE
VALVSYRPELFDLVSPDAELEPIASGFVFTEGPVWNADGAFLLFVDIPGNTIYRWQDAETTVFRRPSNFANGLTYDAHQRLVTCEHTTSRVTRTEHDGTITTIASHFEGRELNSPNDVVVGSDGAVYFTDPMSGRTARMGTEREPELPFLGVYRVPVDGEAELLVDDFPFPNGLCFSPDESLLYVNDSAALHIRVFDVQPDGSVTNGRVFLEQPFSDTYPTGKPDGMKVDEYGNLYATGPGGVWVVEPGGAVLGIIETPEMAGNLNWGGEDWSALYITARSSVYRLQTSVRGNRLAYMR